MQPAENKDYSRDVILRLSPTRNTIIVEEQKPGGIAAYREIDPLELYYVINQSYASNDYLDSGFLPEHCLHLSMSATEKYFVLWNKRQAEVIRLVFVDGIPTKEVAASFGLTYRTIDRIKRTAIENLAEMYAYSDQFRV